MSSAVAAVSDFVGHTYNVVSNEVAHLGDVFLSSPILQAVAIIASGPYAPLTAAAITGAKGGNIGDMAKSAVIAYGAQQLSTVGSEGASTTYMPDGSVVETAASRGYVGDLTSKIGAQVGDASFQSLGTATAQGLNSSVFNGAIAALSGKPIAGAMAAGFVGGAVGSGVSQAGASFFGANADWGISPSVQKQLTGVAGTLVNAGISGQDPAKALESYIANAMVRAGATEIGQQAKDAAAAVKGYYNEVTTSQSAMTEAEQQYAATQQQAQALQDQTNQKVEQYNGVSSQMQTASDSYASQRASYDAKVQAYDSQFWAFRYQKKLIAIAEINAGAAQLDTTATQYNTLKAQQEPLSTQIQGAQTQLASYTSTLGALTDKYNNAATTNQQALSNFTTTQARQSGLEKQLQDSIAQAAVQDFTTAAINDGSIAVTSRAADGALTLANGMTFRGGQLYQGDQAAFNGTIPPASAIDVAGVTARYTDTQAAQAASTVTVASPTPSDTFLDTQTFYENNGSSLTTTGAVTDNSPKVVPPVAAQINPTTETQPAAGIIAAQDKVPAAPDPVVQEVAPVIATQAEAPPPASTGTGIVAGVTQAGGELGNQLGAQPVASTDPADSVVDGANMPPADAPATQDSNPNTEVSANADNPATGIDQFLNTGVFAPTTTIGDTTMADEYDGSDTLNTSSDDDAASQADNPAGTNGSTALGGATAATPGIAALTAQIKALTGVDLTGVGGALSSLVSGNQALAAAMLTGFGVAQAASTHRASALEVQNLKNQNSLDLVNLAQTNKLADNVRTSNSIKGLRLPARAGGIIGSQAQPLKRLGGGTVFSSNGIINRATV